MSSVSRSGYSFYVRSIFLMTVLMCTVLAGTFPALAKKHSNHSKNHHGYTTLSKIIHDESTEEETGSQSSEAECAPYDWTDGTWENGCYVNGRGEVLARLSDADRLPFITLKKMKKCSILFVGASQTTRTAQAIKDKDVFFYGVGGARFSWFFKTHHKNKAPYPAYQVIRSFIKLHPHGTVIVDMGGNDIHNVEAYAGFYQDLVKQHPEVKFFFRGVPPREIGSEQNGKRLEFNQRLESAVPGHMINLFEEIYTFPDYKTLDGVHYAKPMTRRIYQMTMDAIGRKVKVNTKNGKVKKG